MVNANIGLVPLPNSRTRIHLCVHVFEYVYASGLCCCGIQVFADFTSILDTEVGQEIVFGKPLCEWHHNSKNLYKQNMIVFQLMGSAMPFKNVYFVRMFLETVVSFFLYCA